MILWLLACSDPAPPPAPAPPPEPSAEEVALARAETLANEAAAKLKTRMVQELGAHGPSEAVEACSMEAEALTASVVPESSGARVGRSSLRLRNPDNQAPVWVQAWLDETGEGAFAGATGIRRIDEGPDGKVARVLMPIGVQPQCLSCHGPEETIPADVRARIADRYPNDAARGYAAGDLRGALWAEIPVKN